MTLRSPAFTICGWLSAAAVLLILTACHGQSPPSSAGSAPTPGAASSTQTYDDPSPGYDDDRQMPADHTVDWIRRHGALALGQGNDCAVCHGEDECVDCHVESLDQPYTVHPPNYEIVHATDADQGTQDCASCHRLDTFCEACHIEAGVSPRLDDRPPSNVDFHPPDWLDPGAPQNHATEARRDINDCASCHTEQDCVSCHRGINPHPPEFHLDCGRILETNPSSRAQCHTEDLDILRQMCM